jgi:N-acetylglucosamine-6-phosphate deacetylase
VTRRIFLSGADLVLPDRIDSGRTLVIEAGAIADIVSGPRDLGADERRVHLPGAFILPGFVDVHVHGVEGFDVLDGEAALLEIAARLPRYGVASFCPTSIACPPETLTSFLAGVASARQSSRGARVLPAHLESNFISPAWNGAQPAGCLRVPAAALQAVPRPVTHSRGAPDDFSGAEILQVIDRQVADVAIITVAPELDGGLRLIERLARTGVRLSLGHSGASFEQGQAAIAAGARHATHLFNRMPPMTHREPGLAGAILASEEVAAEIICDGHHVHAGFVRLALGAKGRGRVMAITDGTAGSGLPRGTRASLGGRPITVDDVARLDDGTIAGSVATMDRVFGWLVGGCGLNLREAAGICSTTPARELGLVGHGVIAPGAAADLTVMDRTFTVLQTWIRGEVAWAGTSVPQLPSPSA